MNTFRLYCGAIFLFMNDCNGFCPRPGPTDPAQRELLRHSDVQLYAGSKFYSLTGDATQPQPRAC